MRPYVFDDTALVALFIGHERVFALWSEAERQGVPVLFPASAIAAANHLIHGSDGAWSALLEQPSGTVVLDLTLGNAPAAGRCHQDLVIGHVSVEARAVNATVLTARRDVYDPSLRILNFEP